MDRCYIIDERFKIIASGKDLAYSIFVDKFPEELLLPKQIVQVNSDLYIETDLPELTEL
jgi:hypothetical protein